MIDTWLCYSTHTSIEVASHDPLGHYFGVLAPREPCPSLSLIVLSGALYTGSKSSEFSFRSYQSDDLERAPNG